nr:serine hydrolase [Ectobacillus ponti]
MTIFALGFGILTPFNRVFAESNANLDIKAASAILVEAKSGKILYGKNVDESLAIASMTKMLTEYLVHEAVEQGKIKWDQKTTVSEYAHLISQNRDLSNVPLENGGSYTVKELYEAMAIYSANGATIALAELIGGSETNFISLMNKKAQELGMKNSRFVNATGLSNRDLQGKQPAGTDPNDENKMSARDAAILAQRLITDYPSMLKTSSIPKKTFQEGGKYPVKMDNWNWMLPGLVYGYEGMDGLKTGSTPEAGYCFTGTAERDGVRFISVVIKTDSYQARFEETKKLMDYGFGNYDVKEVYPKGYAPKEKSTAEVVKGKEKQVSFETTEAVVLPIMKGSKDGYAISYKMNNKQITAPVKKGAKVGQMIVSAKGSQDPGFLQGQTLKIDLVTKDAVEKANWFVLMGRGIGSFFGQLWTGAVDTVKGWF